MQTNNPRKRLWEGLVPSIALGLLLLAASVFVTLSNLGERLDASAMQWMQVQQIFEWPMVIPFLLFGAAQVLLHVLLGAAVWIVSILSHRAIGGGTRRAHILVWFALCSFWIFLANASAYPWSLTAPWFKIFSHSIIAGASMFDLISGALLAAIALCVWRLVRARPLLRKALPRVILYGIGLCAVIPLMRWVDFDAFATDAAGTQSRPNVIIVGIDSLRPDFVGAANDQPGHTPELDLFLEEATLFTDAVTPLARTFAAWSAILTGKAPINTKVRDNLTSRETSRISTTLADRFRSAGYSTLYATDEVRFSNIDESYGFDRVVAPRMGITDFILGSVNDIPLSNLFANTWVGALLFPDTYMNRAAAATYRAETFVEAVSDAVEDVPRPAFIAMHLTLPHHPYHWSEDENSVFSRTTDLKYAYASSVVAVDRQFGELMRRFEDEGLLNNAIVIVLSDHGEALGLPRDNLIYSKEAKQIVGPLRVSMSSHGNSVLSPYQFSVVLAARAYGPAARRWVPGLRATDVPATLEDVAPTSLELAGIDVQRSEFDGRSLAGVLRGEAVEPDLLGRFRFTETGFPVDFVSRQTTLESELQERAVDQFRVDRETRRVVLRPESMPVLLRVKQRAAMKGQWMLAAVPHPTRGMVYVFADRRGAELPKLVSAENASTDELISELWAALHAHFQGELPHERGSPPSG